MANLERKYIITMRREFKKVPKYLRARKAVKVVRVFLQQHMKCEDVRLEKHLNLLLWSRGNRNPPHRVEVLATKYEEKDRTFVRAEIVGAPKEVKEEPKKKGLVNKLKSSISVKDSQEEKKKEEQKEELKELKKEEQEVMEHTEAPKSKAETKSKKKEQTGFEKERAAVSRDKKETQHKKSQSQ